MVLQQTPLYDLCVNAGGRMVPFAGWEMPVQFSSVLNEHEAVRKEVGLFDISHMGVLLLEGQNPKDALQSLVPSDLQRIGKGEACYTLLLNENGGVIDDLIIYDLGNNNNGQESILIIINASRYEVDLNWIKQHLISHNISISNAKENKVLLALQGPKAKSKIQTLCEESLELIPKFGHRQIQLKSLKDPEFTKAFIARTGYTGEEGFELLLPSSLGKKLWLELIDDEVIPCGLGARDTLRLEAAMHLYGHELTTETTPFEAGLGWLVHLEMPSNFIGRNALEKQAKDGITRKLVGLKIQGRAIARHGYNIFHEGKLVGEISSGSWSPTLNEPIALAYLPIELAKLNTSVQIEVRGQQHPAKVVKKPFYRKKD